MKVDAINKATSVTIWLPGLKPIRSILALKDQVF